MKRGRERSAFLVEHEPRVPGERGNRRTAVATEQEGGSATSEPLSHRVSVSQSKREVRRWPRRARRTQQAVDGISDGGRDLVTVVVEAARKALAAKQEARVEVAEVPKPGLFEAAVRLLGHRLPEVERLLVSSQRAREKRDRADEQDRQRR